MYVHIYMYMYVYMYIYIDLHACIHTHGGQFICFFSHFLLKRSLNAVLHESELSDQLDVTLESSKVVTLALTWVVTTQSDAIK